MTNTALKTQIDTDITNKSATKSITPLNVGSNTKAIVDYVDQESNLKENSSNKSTNVTTDAASDTKYPSVKAVKTYVDTNVGGVKISQQVTASASTPPDIKDLSYVRIFASGSGQGIQITGTPATGKEWYIKNTTAYDVQLFGASENINGNNWIMLPANSYWHLVKEDSGTNSITAFSISLNLNEVVSNKSTNVTTDGASNTKYPSVKAIKDYVDAKLPYKVYTALISQSGTSAPTLVVLQNTLGDTITSLYNGVGNYTFQLATLNLFIASKTFILLNSSYNSNAYLGIVRGDDSQLLVNSVSNGSNSNNVLVNASLEIRVYN